MSYHFTKIFVHLLVLVAVSNFNVYKLSGTQQTFTCSKPTVETLEKGVNRYEIYSKIINTAERRCIMALLLTLNIFHAFF